MSYWEDFRDEALANEFDPVKRKETRKKKVSKPKRKKKVSKPKHKKIASFEVDALVDFDGRPLWGKRRIQRVHDESLCEGRACVIHSPSDHHMRHLPLVWDSQGTQMQRLCPHDLLHPDPDDLAYWVDIANQPWKANHYCPCTCCEPTENKTK